MSTRSCIFCQIIAHDIPATIITQNEEIIVIKDIAPKAPIHYLIIPKKHIDTLNALEYNDIALMSNIVLMAQQLSKKNSGSDSFRLVINNGADAGQSVFHLHAHFLSGKRLLDL